MMSLRKWDPGHGPEQVYTSSDDEDELSHLKPKDLNGVHGQTTTTQPQPVNNSTATPSAGKGKQSRSHRSGGHVAPVGRNYFLGPPGVISGATSPNDSDNTYAEASLLGHSRYDPAKEISNGQNTRYDQEIEDYDSEIYSNDALDSVLNHKYQQIMQHQTQRSPTDNSKQTQNNYATNFRQLQTPESKSPFLGSSGGSTRTNGRSTSSMASSSRRAGSGSGGSSTTASSNIPPMLPSDPPGLRRAGNTNHGWEAVGPSTIVSYNSPQGVGHCDPASMLETRLGAQNDSQRVAMQFNPNATLMADRRNRNPIIFGNTLHRRSLSEDSLGVDKSGVNSAHLQHMSTEPVVMPGFPVRTVQAHPPPPYSPSREKFLSGKKCQFHCSWKLVALALTLLTIILSSVIAYFGAVKFPGTVHVQASHSSLPVESVIVSPECPPTIVNDLANEFSQIKGGQPQAVLPQGGQGFGIISDDPATTSAAPQLNSVSQLVPGQWYTVRIDPLNMWKTKLVVRQPSNYQFNLTVLSPDGSVRVTNLAIYGRDGQPPSVTNYDWVHLLSSTGEAKSLVKRSASPMGLIPSGSIISIIKMLTVGEWYLGVLNDGDETCTVRAVVGQKRHGKVCVNDCNGHGTCDDGVCRCFPQFSGPDCSQNVCPVLCSGHGVYGGGQCHCVDGWKGPECDVHDTECIVADCSGHGHCREGVCICQQGWSGENCQTRDCLDRHCSGHGSCQDGNCLCDIGWMGRHCEKRNEALFQCLPDCSGHGRFDPESGKCHCQPQWTGRDCNITLCSLDCGPHGTCLGSKCVCQTGWDGPSCDNVACDLRCGTHGQCKNGTCACRHGFYGKHCTLVGCGEDASCHGHGVCEAQGLSNKNNVIEIVYSCKCNPGWVGSFCEIPEESDCEDTIDNDGNGLTDCSDSKCCSHESCKKSIMCLYLAEPTDVLAKRPSPDFTTSFLEKVKFMYEGDESVQNYAKHDIFDSKRVSIIRGRVITMSGQGIIGVRVSVDRTKDATNYGFTLTRPGGWFDMAVNGGGGVTLQFQRSPLKATTRTTYLPWNRILVINPIVMTPYGGAGINWDEEDTSFKVRYSQPCFDHDYEMMQPKIITSYQPYPMAVESPLGGGGIMPELRVVRESIRIPGSNAYLMYRSTSSAGMKSTIDIQLTGKNISSSLMRVHLVVRISGTVFKKTFEADKDLWFTYSWDKRNVYLQQVFGISDAEVSVGYQYSSCTQTIWNVQTTKVRGFDEEVSHIGSWNLNVHNFFNTHQGLLLRGDGSLLNLKTFPKLSSLLMGVEGQRRALECSKSECDGLLGKVSLLLNVVSLTSGPDGSLYIGDYNLVRKVSKDGKVATILQFGSAQGAYDYDLTISPANNMLYLSHAKKHQIWKIEVLDGEKVKDPKTNWKAVVGTGERCLPGGGQDCGDGGPAVDAKLDYPKSVSISVDRTMYISDGRHIRVVNSEGVIDTLIGDKEGPSGPPKPPECKRIFTGGNIRLQWPTKLAISPLDNTLHIVDDAMVLRLTPDMRLQAVAGVSPLCDRQVDDSKDLANRRKLSAISDIDFGPDGTLFVVEMASRKKKKSNIFHVNHFGKISQIEAVQSFNNSTDSSTVLQSALALSVSPDETIFIANEDQLAKIYRKLPQPDKDGNVRVTDPINHQVYTFNKFGQQISSHNIDTGSLLYKFGYTNTNERGFLTSVSDYMGNKLAVSRDYSDKVQYIENAFGQKFSLKFTSGGNLESFQLSSNDETTSRMVLIGIDDDSSGLVTSTQLDNGEFAIYEYDKHGRAKSMNLASGDYFVVEDCNLFNQTKETFSSCLNVLKNGETLTRITTDLSGKINHEGNICNQKTSTSTTDWSLSSPPCSLVQITSSNYHPLLRSLDDDLALLFKIPTNIKAVLKGSKPFELAWNYGQISGQFKGLGNGNISLARYLQFGDTEQLVKVSYDGEVRDERVADGRGQDLVVVRYDGKDLPSTWYSQSTGNCTQTYDKFYRLIDRRCATEVESLTYNDRNGHLEEQKRCQKRPIKFVYGTTKNPRDIILPSGRRYSYEYDYAGGLSRIKLPGNAGSFTAELQTGLLGRVKFVQKMPGFNDPHVTYWSGDGKLLQIRPPVSSSGGIMVFRYLPDGRLKSVASGDVSTEFGYHMEGWLTRVEHKTDFISIKLTEMREKVDEKDAKGYNSFTDQRITFDSKSGFASAKFMFTFGPGNDLVSVTGRIGGQTLPNHIVRNSLSLITSESGITKTIGQFFAHIHNLNETTISDGVASFERSKSAEIFIIGGREVHRAEYGYDGCGRLEKKSVKTMKSDSEDLKFIKYRYDDDGQIEKATFDQVEYRYAYDDNGNLLSTEGTTDQANIISLEYDSSGRLARLKKQQFNYEYDNHGRVTSDRNRNQITYQIGDLLSTVKVLAESNLVVMYHYDHLGRLCGRKDSTDNVTQYFYAFPDKPFLVSHAYSPRTGKLTTLIYDNLDRLIFVDIDQRRYYVVTDQLGSPLLYTTPTGKIVREITRTPYGHVTFDSEKFLDVPIGFAGGIFDPVTQLIHIQGPGGSQPYDPFTGTFLTPRWKTILQNILDPMTLRLYRYPRNDPVNKNGRNILSPEDLKENVKTNLESAFPILNINNVGNVMSNTFIHSTKITNILVNHPNSWRLNDDPVSPAYAVGFMEAMQSVLSVSSMRQSLLVFNPSERISFSRRDPPVGKYVLVSRDRNQQAAVKSIAAGRANEVTRAIFQSVLDAAYIVEYGAIGGHGGADSYHFTKPNIWEASEDIKSLYRLGPLVNLTTHDTQADTGVTMDVKVHLDGAVINIRYGSSPDSEKARLLRHAFKTLVRRAWLREKDSTSNKWDSSQLQQLMHKGFVDGYEVAYKRDPQTFPELANDLENVHFVAKQPSPRRKLLV